jgi:hypothetical protein
MTTYKLNGAPAEVISRRSINGRRWCKVEKPDGTVEEVLYRALERHRDGTPITPNQRCAHIRKEKRPGYTVPQYLLDCLSSYSPSQIGEIKRRKVKDREKAYWIVQNKAKQMTGKPYATKAELRAAEEELSKNQ